MSKKIHIVWNPNRQDVITRLATALAEGTGWSISKTPNPKADLNYYMLYLSYAQSPFNKTPVAAWFSHYETHVPKKAAWWDYAAEHVDIRTTTAPQYQKLLAPYGKTFIVQPPVDTQFFSKRKWRIGVVGYVHPGGRKGENLIKRLAADLPQAWELTATGKEWGIPAQEQTWAGMASWYQSIDVLLCPSLIEGVPMPPLEALAANLPIVIPYDVGMLNAIELVSEHGVYRYDAGDYNSLWQTLNTAYHSLHRRTLWAERYSIEQWAYQHRIALEGDNYAFPDAQKPPNLPQIEELPPVPITTSIIMPTTRHRAEMDVITVYVAYGETARNMATKAIQSWKQWMASPVCLISDSPLNAGEDVFIQHEDTDIGARSVKTRLYDLVPPEYQSILYLDADTEITADVGFMFRLLEEGYDFAICFNPQKYFSIGQHLRPDNQAETDETVTLLGHGEMLLYNGGVFALRRNERTKRLMTMWHQEWERYGARDQMALIRSLFLCPVKVCYLTQAWNTIVRYTDVSLTAGIIHHPQSARRWEGSIQGRLDSPEAWAAVKRFENKKD